jgi:hypothetical protein
VFNLHPGYRTGVTAFDDQVPNNDANPVNDDHEDAGEKSPADDPEGRPAMEGGDRERGDRGPGADEAGRRSHELSQGKYGSTADYGDG